MKQEDISLLLYLPEICSVLVLFLRSLAPNEVLLSGNAVLVLFLRSLSLKIK